MRSFIPTVLNSGCTLESLGKCFTTYYSYGLTPCVILLDSQRIRTRGRDQRFRANPLLGTGKWGFYCNYYTFSLIQQGLNKYDHTILTVERGLIWFNFSPSMSHIYSSNPAPLEKQSRLFLLLVVGC